MILRKVLEKRACCGLRESEDSPPFIGTSDAALNTCARSGVPVNVSEFARHPDDRRDL